MLGDIFGGNGVVVAPAQKQERALWDEITVAMVAPAPKATKKALGLDGIIEQAAERHARERARISKPCSGRSAPWTHKPAEMLKVAVSRKIHRQRLD